MNVLGNAIEMGWALSNIVRAELETTRIVLALLSSVERDGIQSQRKLASELGIALGLVNAYLKRCVRKGLLKVGQAPARRYAYYLTPRGFHEKARLSAEYLAASFDFFRRARRDCSDMFAKARERGWLRVALVGISDLTEIAAISALESGIEVVAIIDPQCPGGHRIGLPVVVSRVECEPSPDGVIVTGVLDVPKLVAAAIAQFGRDRVLVPSLLGIDASSVVS